MAVLEPKVLQGKVKWAHVFRPDQYGKWSLNLYPTPESLEVWKSMKLMNHLKHDDDGYYFKLSRPTEKEWMGKKQGLVPPEVVDKDGAPTILPIGNGSDVKVELEHFSWKDKFSNTTKFGARIKRVKVMNLIPYSRSDMTPEQQASEDRLEHTDASLAF